MIKLHLRSHAALIATLGLTTAYAVLRYNVFKGVGWEHLPLYVLNKSIAWSSVILFAIAARQAVRTRGPWVLNTHFVEGCTLAGVHVLVSLPLLTPANYQDFFDPALRFKGSIEIALLAGVLGVLSVVGAWRAIGFALLLPIAVLIHIALLGVGNWFAPATWPGYMIPITLLSSLSALATVILTIAWAVRRPHE